MGGTATMRLISPPLTLTLFLWGYFDAAAKDDIFGCGEYIIINSRTVYHIYWNGCNVSNTRVEVLELWGLILCACSFGLVQL